MIYDISKSLRDLITSLPDNEELHKELKKDFERDSYELAEMKNEFILEMKNAYYLFSSI